MVEVLKANHGDKGVKDVLSFVFGLDPVAVDFIRKYEAVIFEN